MHSRRMRTARGSSRPLGEVVSVSVHAGIHTPPGVDLETPSGVSLETPSGVSLETPLDVGLETSPPSGQTSKLPPRCGPGDPLGDLQGMLGYHLQGMLG